MPRPIVLSLLVLSACQQAAAPENAARDIDPVVTTAINDPLMTDPLLEGRSNRDTRKPADEPYRALLPTGEPSPLRGNRPPTVLARMGSELASAPFANCDRRVRYSYGWAAGLSDALKLPATAKVAEGAGSDMPTCALRLIAFDGGEPSEKLIERYRRIAGYRVSDSRDADATVLRGTGANGAAFVAVVYPEGQVDFLTNRGR
jgi:hypothetical protein